MTRMFDLAGKPVLATGANSGIDLGFLTSCGRQGADVGVRGRRTQHNLKLLEALRAAGARRTHQEATDVSDEAAVQAAFADTTERPEAYLASDASRFHTVDILSIDGERTVKSL